MVNLGGKKTGFSLAEALVSMLVLSLFFIATSKIITVKPKPESENTRHGYFECFYENGILKQKIADEMSAGTATDAANGTCSYEPPVGIASANIYILNDGMFYNTVEPIFDGSASTGDSVVRIAGTDISTLPENFTDMDNGSTNLPELLNFFESCYPSSSIYRLLKNDGDDGDENQYQGPALFIGW